MNETDLSAPPATRYGVMIAVALLHIIAVLALIRAFAPELTASVEEKVLAAFTVTVTTPPPSPKPVESKAAGKAAPPGKKATPREVSAKKPKIAIVKPSAAPKIAGKGSDNSSGAKDKGTGSGAGGQGDGTGAGSGGDGQGGGAPTKAEKIAGDINSTRDYPKSTRKDRSGQQVTIALTIGTDGRVKACRVHQASPVPEADQITCQLAMQRFRFKPATNNRGEPVQSEYGWRQRWYDPRD